MPKEDVRICAVQLTFHPMKSISTLCLSLSILDISHDSVSATMSAARSAEMSAEMSAGKSAGMSAGMSADCPASGLQVSYSLQTRKQLISKAWNRQLHTRIVTITSAIHSFYFVLRCITYTPCRNRYLFKAALFAARSHDFLMSSKWKSNNTNQMPASL